MYYKNTILLLFLMLVVTPLMGCETGKTSLPSFSSSGADSECKDIISASTTEREFVTEDASYAELRENIIKVALNNIVAQTLGIEIRSSTSMVVTDEEDAFDERTSRKLQGQIKSYDIVYEDIVSRGDREILKIEVEADVCKPHEDFFEYIVAVNDLSIQGQQSKEYREILISSLPSDERFIITQQAPEDIYHDIVLEGNVTNISTSIVTNPTRRRTEMFGSFFKPAQDWAEGYDEAVKEISIQFLLIAENVVEKETTSKTVLVEEYFPKDTKKNEVINLLIAEAVKQSGEELFVELSK